MSDPTPKLSVVIPLYNEEDNVALLQEEVDKALEGIEDKVADFIGK